MKRLLFSLTLLLGTSGTAYAEQQVCLSNDALPKHCNAGDIIVVRPKEVATTCDFTQQIVKLQPSKDAIEFLCRYTGKILKVKPNTSLPPQPVQPMYPQQPPKKRSWMW